MRSFRTIEKLSAASVIQSIDIDRYARQSQKPLYNEDVFLVKGCTARHWLKAIDRYGFRSPSRWLEADLRQVTFIRG